ncbi:segregation and condensation protein A [Weissella bombi]|uniref:Segregation and condensation protein A n=1 Tax=Weissella bombi TaxID=1505725 RepID=A0A1C3Z4E8_9LACO|nr:segregation/condensation protein A [Weissella bombi]SCB77160.1 condensin subunit ScpA [Weissella bombi]
MNEKLAYHIEDFDGPLDLLLHLIRVNEMDIMDIPIVEITSQYLDFLHQAQERNLDVAGEFLVMAATLMSIKARYLLPQNDVFEYDEELAEFVTDTVDPRDELMMQLQEYQRFQQAAGELRNREEERQLQFSRAPMALPADVKGAPLPDGLTLDDLQLAFNKLVKRRFHKQVQTRSVQNDTWSIQKQMNKLMDKLAIQSVISFEALFEDDVTKDEVVTTFMAMLELVGHQHIQVKQNELFASIDVMRGDKPYDQMNGEGDQANAK